VDAAVAQGAVAAMVDDAGAGLVDSDVPLLIVDDTTRGLGDLATAFRRRVTIPVLAVGGSNGKTTTKDMIAAVLATKFRVLRTNANLNNQIGVPLTLLRLTGEHEIAVIEVGTNHPGEVPYLTSVVQPTHALVTCIGREHLEFFGSLEGVAEEETALWRKVGKAPPVALVNMDDPFLKHGPGAGKRRVTYGFAARHAGIVGSMLKLDNQACARFRFRSPRMRTPATVRLNIPGRHNALNALAAVAVGLTFRVPPGQIASALGTFAPSARRMEVVNINGITILNDTYNANPDSMIAALQTLRALDVAGKRIAVLADMLELGIHAAEEHRRVGEAVLQSAPDYLLTFGEQARLIGEAARGVTVLHYTQKNMLAEYLAELLTPGDGVLIKGSRGMKMEDLVTFLGERLPAPGTEAPDGRRARRVDDPKEPS
jgi:UDP-N-acetylmuramoyl-tripeptide--D-alanyl-D-alanine ligase